MSDMHREQASILKDRTAFDPSRKRWRDVTLEGTTGTGVMSFLAMFVEAVAEAQENGLEPPRLRVADRQGYEWRSEAGEVFLLPGMLMFRYFHDLSGQGTDAEALIETVAVPFEEVSFVAYDEAIPSKEHLARRGGASVLVPPEGVSNHEKMSRLQGMRGGTARQPAPNPHDLGPRGSRR